MPTSQPPRRPRDATPNACPWTARVWSEWRAGNFSREARDVLLTLRSFRGAGGLCVPAHGTLADRARCSVSTIGRAMKRARELGLLAWSERRRRVGWRSLRSSNSYMFIVPADAVQPCPQPPRRRAARTDRHGDGEEESSSKKEALRQMLNEAAARPPASEIAAAAEARFAARWQAERAARMGGRAVA